MNMKWIAAETMYRHAAIHRNCRRTVAAAMLCASNMSALIPPGCAAISAASSAIPAPHPGMDRSPRFFWCPGAETTDAHGWARIRNNSKLNYIAGLL